MKSYTPQLTKYVSWEEIEDSYIDLISFGWQIKPMHDLVKHIRNSDHKNRLFAFTSMHKLIVSIYKQIDHNSEALHIEFDQHTRKWSFQYRSKPYDQNVFKRTYNEELGIEKFEQFLEYVNW